MSLEKGKRMEKGSWKLVLCLQIGHLRDGWTFQSWYGPEKTFSRKGMVCCKHGHHPLRFTGLAHGWFVSASSCAFLLEHSNLFVSIHFDQVRLHRWRDTCPVSGWVAGIWYPEFHPGFPQLACCHSRKISFPSFEYISPNNLRTLRFPIRTYDKIWSNLCSKKIDPSQPQLISVQPLAAICFSNATRYSGQAKMPGFSWVT